MICENCGTNNINQGDLCPECEKSHPSTIPPPQQPTLISFNSSLVPGNIIGDGAYKITELIDAKGSGEVYKALDTKTNSIVAVKVFPGLIYSKVPVESIEEQLTNIYQLNHPNIVKVYRWVNTENNVFFVMEFVHGTAINLLIENNGVLPLDRIISIGRSICNGLEYLHENGFTQRDLKPSKIMFNKNFEIKILDVGTDQVLKKLGKNLTRGMNSENLIYTSPQLIKGESPHPQDNVYSLGIILYELITGKPPFASGDISHQQLHVPPTPLTQLRPQTPEELNDLVLFCLAKEPKDRFQSVSDVADLLDNIKPQQQPIPSLAKTSPQPKKITHNKFNFKHGLAIAATLITLLIVGLFISQTKNKDTKNTIPAPVTKPISIISPAENEYINKHFCTVEGEVLSPGKEISVNNEYCPVTGNRFSKKLVFQEDGKYTIVIKAGDKTYSRTVIIDTKTPVLKILEPVKGVVETNSMIEVRGTIDDDNPVTISVQDSNPVEVPLGKFMRPVKLHEGNNLITVMAKDLAGNKTKLTRTVKLDSTPPLITRLYPPPGKEFTKPSVKIVGKTSEDLYTAQINGIPAKIIGSRSFNSKLKLQKGFNPIIIELKDYYENTFVEKNYFLYYDPKPFERLGRNKQGYRTYRKKKDDSIMILVKKGSFIMGSKDPDAFLDEKPAHKLKIPAFYIDQYEVTVAQYKKFCSETGRELPKQPPWSDDNHPVVNISWFDANAYCQWAGKRLPSESEWEYTARGKFRLKSYTYTWGKDFDCGKGNFDDEKKHDLNIVPGDNNCDGYIETSPVGSFPPNSIGLYDMEGNVSEWCGDWFDEYYYNSRKPNDPAGPPKGEQKVFRGGAWNMTTESLRISSRFAMNPDYSDFTLGCRCARDYP